jgi:hypothetical protein
MTEFQIFALILLCICAGCLIAILRELVNLHHTVAEKDSNEDQSV